MTIRKARLLSVDEFRQLMEKVKEALRKQEEERIRNGLPRHEWPGLTPEARKWRANF